MNPGTNFAPSFIQSWRVLYTHGIPSSLHCLSIAGRSAIVSSDSAAMRVPFGSSTMVLFCLMPVSLNPAALYIVPSPHCAPSANEMTQRI